MLESIKTACRNIDVNVVDTQRLFTEIMSSNDQSVILSVSKYLWDAFRLRETFLLEESRSNIVVFSS